MHLQAELFDEDAVHYALLVVDHEVDLFDDQRERVDVSFSHVHDYIVLPHE